MFTPDETSPSSASASSRRSARQKPSTRKSGGAPAEKKEARGSFLLHELCRRMGFDARHDNYAREIISELGASLTKGKGTNAGT